MGGMEIAVAIRVIKDLVHLAETAKNIALAQKGLEVKEALVARIEETLEFREQVRERQATPDYPAT